MASESEAYAQPKAVVPHRDEMLYITEIENLQRRQASCFPDSPGLTAGEIERVQTIWRPDIEIGGVLRKMKLVEAIAQAGCVGVLYDQKVRSDGPAEEDSSGGIVPLFAGIPGATFEGEIWQPDTLAVDVRINEKNQRDFAGIGVVTTSIHGHKVADAVITGKMISPKMADRLFENQQPVIADPEDRQHNKKLPLPEEFFERNPRDTWLDGVVEANAQEAEGFWLPDEYQYRGHFPGRPVLPGIKQVGSIEDLTLIALRDDDPEAELVGLQNVVFKRPIQPEERADVSVDLVEIDGPWGEVRYISFGTVKVEGAIACKGALFFGSRAA